MHLKNKHISIVGAGLVGSLLSIYLKKQGAKVSVFDKRPDLRHSSYSGARSINLALSERGIKALRKIGIEDLILKIAMPMYKRIMHSINGDLTEQLYGTNHEAIYSISRKSLNAKLIDIAEENKVDFFFNQTCLAVDIINTKLNFVNGYSVDSDFIFGADGAGSIVRKEMSKLFQDINVTETNIGYGYKELTIDANYNGSHKLSNNALHIWPRKSYMIIALPNLDGTFTCTLFAPIKGENSFESLRTNHLVDTFFATNFSDLQRIVPNISDQYFISPLSSLGLVRCSQWMKNDTILIGDACHATVPFYGQGMNSGFEDCYLLNDWIDKNNRLHKDCINDFFQKRIVDTMSMQDLSMSNFIEMRDKTANPDFLLQKKIEFWFSKKHPNKWVPLYSMVTFSDIRYSKAVVRGKIQDGIMKTIMQKNNLSLNFDIKELERKNIEQQMLVEINRLCS